LRALRAMGRAVPGDVALVGFDDPIDGDLLDPPITALGRHYRDLGEIAARVLLDALRNGHDGDPVAIRVPLELIVRTSCGC
jgi:LacI family transcriptional regulator